MKPALVVQHLEPEGPYAIAAALEEAGLDVVVHRADLDGPPRATAGSIAALVVMGGPMTAYSDEGFPSRAQETALLADAVALGVPVLGVCLGAQLLSAATGGRVYSGGRSEIGWAPVRLAPEAARDPLFAGCPAEIPVLHWHGDTYELPPGGVHLASSAAYEQQAFRVGERAWGVQFHLEVDEAAVAAFVGAFSEETGREERAIVAGAAAALAVLTPAREMVLRRFAAIAAGRAPAAAGA